MPNTTCSSSWQGLAKLSRYQQAERQRYLARQKLAERLGRVIASLRLDRATIATLPDNYVQATRSNAKSIAQPAHSPLSPHLFDAAGPWICIRGAAPGPSAPVHMQRFGGRSPFLVFIHLPGGRNVGLDYIRQLHEYAGTSSNNKYEWERNVPLFPEGTAVALVRRMVVIDDNNQLTATPLVQSIQMRVYPTVANRRIPAAEGRDYLGVHKWTLSRAKLLAGAGGGLVAATEQTRAVSKLSEHIRRQYQWDSLDGGRAPSTPYVLESCFDCHMGCGGGPNAKSIFTYNQFHWRKEIPGAEGFQNQDLRLVPTDVETELTRAIQWKTQRVEWSRLQAILANAPPASNGRR